MDSSVNFFPAGDESESSGDEWDIGSAKEKAPPVENDAGVGYVPAENNQVSVLKIAISKGDTETVKHVLDNGINVDTRLDYEWTPLMCAVSMANYDLAKLLLDRGASANFSKDNWTVLMASCTAPASEDKISSCVELLLSRNADPNLADRFHMTCLMLASRKGYNKLINLLVSHGAAVNAQDSNGFTALCFAVQYGQEGSVLKLLQLGADKTIKTKSGKTPADLADQFKYTQIRRVLASTSNQTSSARSFLSSEVSKECGNKLDDLELLLHGLDLGSIIDIINDHDITWSQLLIMDQDDLHKIGITDPEDQEKLLRAVQQMQLDKVDLETVSRLGADTTGSEELHTFLLSVKQQCCYLTETIQDVVRRFPRKASQVVFSLDPNNEARAVCNQLLIQTKDLQKELTLLRSLLSQVDQAEDCCYLPDPPSKSRWRQVLKGVTLSALGAGTLLLLFKAAGGNTRHL